MPKVLPGQAATISARTFNNMLDAAEYVKQNRHNRSVPTLSPGMPQRGVIRVRNDSGGTLEQFEALEIGAPVISPTQNADEFAENFCFNATIPTTDEARNLVILLEPLAAGAVGRAVAVGVTPAFVARPADVTAMTAGTVAGDTLLRAGGFGATILWEATVADPTLPHWCLVRLPSSEPASGGLYRATIADVLGDYLVCSVLINDVWSDPQPVAKPWILRGTTQRNGETSTPTGTDCQNRTVTKNGNTETQTVTPSYNDNDEIMVAACPVTLGEGESAVDCAFVDVNDSARVWMQSA